jgi:hypothetical protein
VSVASLLRCAAHDDGLHSLNVRPWASCSSRAVVGRPDAAFEVNQSAGWHVPEPAIRALAAGLSWVPFLFALGFATGFVHYLPPRVYHPDPHVRAAARWPVELRPSSVKTKRFVVTVLACGLVGCATAKPILYEAKYRDEGRSNRPRHRRM